jgi:hypothetical protein
MPQDETANLGRAANRGCLLAFLSASVTGVMLFVNGSLIWAMLSVLGSQGFSWAVKPEVSQFLLFLLPVLLCLAQWKLVDYLRRHISP